MARIKSGDVTVDLDVLDSAPTPRGALELMLPGYAVRDLFERCTEDTIEAIGEMTRALGGAIQLQAPPSLRFDISISEEKGVVATVIVQGAPTQSCRAVTVHDAVAAVVRAAAEQAAYQSEDDLRRVAILGQWTRALSDVCKGLDTTGTSIMAAATMKIRKAQDRIDSEKAKDADSSDGKGDDG